jgi:hypothetical protein
MYAVTPSTSEIKYVHEISLIYIGMLIFPFALLHICGLKFSHFTVICILFTLLIHSLKENLFHQL